MTLYLVSVKKDHKNLANLIVFAPGIDAAKIPVGNYMEKNHADSWESGAGCTASFMEVEPSKILTYKAPRKKQRG